MCVCLLVPKTNGLLSSFIYIKKKKTEGFINLLFEQLISIINNINIISYSFLQYIIFTLW